MHGGGGEACRPAWYGPEPFLVGRVKENSGWTAEALDLRTQAAAPGALGPVLPADASGCRNSGPAPDGRDLRVHDGRRPSRAGQGGNGTYSTRLPRQRSVGHLIASHDVCKSEGRR